MSYLRLVAGAFVSIGLGAGIPIKFQVGEPWWWVMPADGRICIYDDAARLAFGGSPVSIPDVRGALSGAQTALLDQAGAMLAASTAALCAWVKGVAPGAVTLLLAYLPTVLDPLAPEAKRANMPVGWAWPAFDVLQLEDYDWVTEGRPSRTARGIELATTRLGYPVEEQHYFSGFVLMPEQAAQWARIADAAEAAVQRGTAATFIWALPQVARDGFTCFRLQGTMICKPLTMWPFHWPSGGKRAWLLPFRRRSWKVLQAMSGAAATGRMRVCPSTRGRG